MAAQPAAAASATCFSNILVLSDLSPAAEAALGYAAAWARRFNAAIHVAHFIRPLSIVLAKGAYGPLVESQWRRARAGLESIAASEILRDIPHSIYLEAGQMEHGVADLIREERADLVVMASEGRRGFSKLLAGSAAESIMRSALCPVLVIGPAADRTPPHDPRHILIATDFGPAAERAALWAVQVARVWGAAVHMLNVLSVPDGDCAYWLSEVEVTEARLRDEVRTGKGADLDSEPIVKFGEAGAEILGIARSIDADLIVLGARPRPKYALGSAGAVVYRVLSEARCPVLTVGEAA